MEGRNYSCEWGIKMLAQVCHMIGLDLSLYCTLICIKSTVKSY